MGLQRFNPDALDNVEKENIEMKEIEANER